MTTERKIAWRAFGDDRLEGAAFGWWAGDPKDSWRTANPRATYMRPDPAGDGPTGVRLNKIRGSSVWRGEFYCAGRTVVVESPLRVPGFEDGYTEARAQAKLRLEERFWREYDAWHASRPEREAAAQAEAEKQAQARDEAAREERVRAAGPMLAHALKAIIEEKRQGRRPDEDLWRLAEHALREAGVTP